MEDTGPTRTAVARWADTGVDETLAGTIDHAGGAVSLISCSLAAGHHNTLQVVGTDGIVDMPLAFTPPVDEPATLLVTRGKRNGVTEELSFPPTDQYTAEAEGFAALVAAGHDADLPQVPLVESLDNAATIDALLTSARTRTQIPIHPS